jgi:XisI protein
MADVLAYQEKIKAILAAYIQDVQASSLDDESYMVADDISKHYLLYHNTWRNNSRTYGCVLHVRIKNEKVYVEYDGTDVGFADVFVEEGIPKENIVLAFHAPAKRQHTGYATA